MHLSKEESRAMVVSALIIASITGITFSMNKCSQHQSNEHTLNKEDAKQARIFNENMAKNMDDEDEANHATSQPFPFDPNHADSITLKAVGLKSWQIKNMMKYRSKGGIWQSAEDFKRLYGLTSEEYERLKPYIRIAPEDRPKTNNNYKDYTQEISEIKEMPYQRVEKYAEGTQISLSQADTTALKGIPGIGSYYASKIVKYRNRLGGFNNIGQLEEIEGLPPGITRWFFLEQNPPIHKIKINESSFKELVRHPYLSYEQTKVIVNHIRRYGPLHSWKDLRLYKEFTDKDFERLAPYFTFN